jgi:XTP/dITP diphosphohydrolase
MKVVAATHNKGKIREFNAILGKLGFEVLSQNDVGIDIEPEENGTTFAQNALIKARAIADLCDYAVVADDSGLCVDALDGAPGVYSARYAGEDATDAQRMEKLLSELKNVSDRKAKFVSAIAFIFPNGEEIVTHGEVPGRITNEICGDGGFGYDPIFLSDELGKTFGEASPDEKNEISHRARGLMALYDILSQKLK